jgi:SAM-dependent methyltransferase
MFKTIDKCRLCNSPEIDLVWDFGISPLANGFKTKENLNKPELEFPLRYFKCSNCHSVQLKDEVDSDILFKEYLYESPPNLIPHFQELAKTTLDYLQLPPGSKVVDIGSNNGLLLQEYKDLGCKVVGFEPCDRIAQKARDKGIGTFSKFFNCGSAEEFSLQYKSPDLITSTNCFAHVSDLNEFVEALTILMDEDSYFVFENAYLFNTLENKDFGQAYFEHFYMHSICPLEKLFAKHGLELFHVSYNNVQMGSIRGFVRKVGNIKHRDKSAVRLAKWNELHCGLLELDIYNNFIQDIKDKKNILISKLGIVKKQGKSISVYAWPAKMTLLNKYFGLEKYIDYVVEESNVKTGKFCPGTKLEIKNLEYFKQNPTDICLIGAYNFEKDIKNKNSWYQGQWINPLNV